MIGIDSVEIRRIARTMGKSFFEKIFTENELSHLEHVRFAPQTVAGMFAVKEAVSKALGTGISSGVSWRDIEVLYNSAGAPYTKLYNKAAEILSVKGSSVLISITHTAEIATAVAIIR